MKMIIKETIKIIPAIFLIISLCCGCQVEQIGYRNPNNSFTDTLPIAADEPKIKSDSPKKIGIYVDTTPSMKGFLGMQKDFYKKLVGETVYASCLDELDNLISVRYDRKGVDYYRVDTPLWSTEENVLKKAKYASYYSDKLYSGKNKKKYKKIDLIKEDGKGYESYCLANALKNCKDDDLSIIVTDFYENEKASSNVTDALKENMSFGGNVERTIGLVGVKSEFAGKIYDLPGQKGPVSYGMIKKSKAKKKNIKYRQFFVIVIGEPSEVTEFCSGLKASMGLKKDQIVSTVFYEPELYGLDYQNYAQCFNRKDRGYDSFMPQQRMVINGEEVPEQYIYRYKNVKEETKEMTVSYSVDSESLKERLQGLKPELVTISLPEPCEKELIEVPFVMENNAVSVWDESEKFVVSDDYLGIFEIQHLYYSEQENLLYVVFWINNSQKLKGGIKLYGELKTSTDGREELCGWVDEWDTGKENLKIDKTWRLKDYVTAIRNGMPERNRVMLQFAFYVCVE